MDVSRAELLRELLAADPLIAQTDEFARTIQRSSRVVGGLLLVGTPSGDPWHLTAHMADEARLAGVAELEPTLVRWSPPPGAPAHLAIGLERLERAERGETVVVVADSTSPDELLERADDARSRGSTVLAVAGAGDELARVAHETLVVPERTLWTPDDLTTARAVSEPAAADDETIDDSGTLELPGGVFDEAFDTTSHLLSVAVGQVARTPNQRMSMRARFARLIDHVTGEPSRW